MKCWRHRIIVALWIWVSLTCFAHATAPTGNRTALSETINTQPSPIVRTYQWAYDYLYRMTGETLGGASYTSPQSATYGFDVVGNRTSRTSTVSGIGNQSATYTVNNWLASDTYDNNGNTTVSSGLQYQYDVLNHLTSVKNGSTTVASLAYDGDGNRVKKTVGTTTTYYLVDDRNPSGYAQVLEEYQYTGSGSPTLNRVYNYGVALISQRQTSSGTISYYGSDGHGSIRFLTDVNGNITDTYTFDAYGLMVSSSGTTPNNYLYSGQQYDSDLGFYYLRARYYKPDSGRFWTMDSYEGDTEDPLSLHKYLYADDNPVNRIDPSGFAASSTSGNSLDAELGKAVEKVIMADFRQKFGINAFTTKSILTALGLNGKARLLEQALPDLVNIQQKSVFEIKPFKPKKVIEGLIQLGGYLEVFNSIDQTEGWHAGSMGEYTPPSLITVNVPPFLIEVNPPVLGMITYVSFEKAVKNKAKTVAVEEETDIEDTEGVAAEDSAMGAP